MAPPNDMKIDGNSSLPNLRLSKDGWQEKPAGWEGANHAVIDNAARLTTPRRAEVESVDVPEGMELIVVLAGGTREDGLPHLWVQERLHHAALLHRKALAHGRGAIPILCCGGGTYHKPNYTNEAGFAVHESTSCGEFLVNQGVGAEHIFKEWSSYDTIANGWFTRRDHIECLGIKNFVVITSEFHMPRTKVIFDWVFGLEPREDYEIRYISVKDVGMDDAVLKERQEREENSRLALVKRSKEIRTLKDFHRFFYMDHKAYSVAGALNDDRGQINGDAKKSY
eukprot:Clim_evm22s149 gene=Clim_evmTU22s149